MELQRLRHAGSDGNKVVLSWPRRNDITDGTDEDSGSDEPQAVPLKKSTLKAIRANLMAAAANRMNASVVRNDEEGSTVSDGPTDTGVSTSCKSAENSDAENAGEVDESQDGKSSNPDDLRKCFECDICNTTFSNGANMRRHRMRHTGVKPYGCKACPKRFFRKDHLAEHIATHTKVLPFKCPICSKGFQRQIAMRAHFQNEHVGGPQEVIKTCPLCSVKAGSMKTLRAHFRFRHGIDLDDPSPSQILGLCSDPEPELPRSAGLQGPSAEYGELGHALGLEERNKSNGERAAIPSHFLVPHIEIAQTYLDSSADSTQEYSARSRQNSGSHTPCTVSPQSDSSSSTVPSSSTVIKREVVGTGYDGCAHSIEGLEVDVQDVPEDLSSTNSSNHNPARCSSSSSSSLSPLKSLLDWKRGQTSDVDQILGCLEVKTQHRSSHNVQPADGNAITSSFGTEASNVNQNAVVLTDAHQQCQFCGIIFPDKTLYFLHKGCHSEGNPWRCNICREVCSNVYDFNAHLLSKAHQ